MKIIVDTREPSELIELLHRKEIETILQPLDVGDYVYVAEDATKSFVIERKTWNDFVSSFTEEKPRLFGQLQNLRLNKEHYRPILIIVGDLTDRYKILAKRNSFHLLKSLRGVVASVAYDFQIPSIVVENESELVDVIISLINQANSPAGERPVEFKKSHKTIADSQADMLTAIKSVGMKTAKKLLTEFGTVKNVINQEKTKLQESVGKSVGEKVYNTVNGIEGNNVKNIPRRRSA